MTNNTTATNNAAVQMLRRHVDRTGMIPVANARSFMHGLGIELQGIPTVHRRKTIARLKEQANLMRSSGMPEGITGLIDALCEGWENFGISE